MSEFLIFFIRNIGFGMPKISTFLNSMFPWSYILNSIMTLFAEIKYGILSSKKSVQYFYATVYLWFRKQKAKNFLDVNIKKVSILFHNPAYRFVLLLIYIFYKSTISTYKPYYERHIKCKFGYFFNPVSAPKLTRVKRVYF